MINMRSDDFKKITPGQIRAARALLKISAQELADAASVGVATLRRAENDDSDIEITPANANAIRTALEDYGIEFIPENGGGSGVRLRERSED